MSKTQTLEQAGTLTESEFTQTPSAGELVTAGPREKLAQKIALYEQLEERRKRKAEEKSAMHYFMDGFWSFARDKFYLRGTRNEEIEIRKFSIDEVSVMIELFHSLSVKRGIQYALAITFSFFLTVLTAFLFSSSIAAGSDTIFVPLSLGLASIFMTIGFLCDCKVAYILCYRKLKKLFGKDANEKIYEAIHGKFFTGE